MSRKLIIHIGYPKAGSTSLQRHFFKKSKKVRYLGKDDGLGGEDKYLKPVFNFINNLAHSNEDSIDKLNLKFIQFIEDTEIARYGDTNTNIPILISFETFTAVLLKPFNLGGLWVPDPKLLFKRLKKFGEKYKFDICLILIEREFKEFVHSWYAQHYYRFVKVPSVNTLQKFLRGELEGDNINLGLKWFMKDKLYNLLIHIFEQEKVYRFDFDSLFKVQNSPDQLLFNELFGLKLSDYTFNVENKREVSQYIKLADIRSPSENKKSFLNALKIAFKEFKYHYYPSTKLQVPIIWDEDCYRLVEKLENKYLHQ
jgi:hypothetical protein